MPCLASENKFDDSAYLKALFVEGPSAARMEPAAPNITRGDVDRPEVALTFDGGAEDGDAQLILETLRRKGVKATMFLTGRFISRYPDIVRRIVGDGHEVGNHTLTHPHLTEYAMTSRQKTLPNVDREIIEKELEETSELFRSVTGMELSPYWRAPYGEYNRDILGWAHEKGYIHIGWTTADNGKRNLDTLDWVNANGPELTRSATRINRRVIGFARSQEGINGGIILMHLGSKSGAMALSRMIDELSGMGYRFVRISELVRKRP